LRRRPLSSGRCLRAVMKLAKSVAVMGTLPTTAVTLLVEKAGVIGTSP